MKNEKEHNMISLILVLLVVAIGTGLFINYSIKDSINRRRALIISMIDTTITEQDSPLTLEQWEIADRNIQLQAARNFLLETSWKETVLDNITMKQLNSNCAFLTDLTIMYLIDNPETRSDSDIKEIFQKIHWLRELAPEVYKDQYQEYKTRMEEKLDS